MSPITSLRDRRLVPNKFRYVQDLILPEQGGTRLSKTINTGEGPMIVSIDHHQAMGMPRGIPEGIASDMNTVFNRDRKVLIRRMHYIILKVVFWEINLVVIEILYTRRKWFFEMISH